MTKISEDLLALQTILRLGDAATPEQKAQIEPLRARIPQPVLAHFLRQLATGRRGIAFVRNGVCGECHIRLSRSMVHMLANSEDVHLCESCGAFVTLAPEENPEPVATPATTGAATPKVRRVSKKSRALAA